MNYLFYSREDDKTRNEEMVPISVWNDTNYGNDSMALCSDKQ